MAKGKAIFTRRRVIFTGIAVGGGLAVGYGVLNVDDGDATEKFAASTPDDVGLNAWIKIAPDGRITCAIHRAEMGQGVTTSLCMMLAEELDADWSKVDFEFAPVDKDYYNFGMVRRGQPFGDPKASWSIGMRHRFMREMFHRQGMSMTISSTSIIDAYDSLRPAGAAARAMLIAAAARRWGVAKDKLRTEQGWVFEQGGERRAHYGELAEDAARQRPPSDPPLKDPADYRIVGTNVARLDTADKLDGATVFGSDVQLPGMRYAAIRQSPVFGAEIDSFDASRARTMAGVEAVIQIGDDAVAVIARRTWQAMKAVEAINITYTDGPSKVMDSRSLHDAYRAVLDDPEPAVFRGAEGVLEALEAAPKKFEAIYETPYLAHACMEPMTCVALVTDLAVELWAPTQAHSQAQLIAAELTGKDPQDVQVHTTFMGGGFGRRTEQDFIKQAVTIAQAVPGQPVRLVWSREEDIQHDMYRPAGVSRMRAGLNEDGNIAALDCTLVTESVIASSFTRVPGSRGGDPKDDMGAMSGVFNTIYGIRHVRAAYVPWVSDIPAGYWRSTSNSTNCFYVESFMDELAHQAGVDPVDFRRNHLARRPKYLNLLEELAKQGDWGSPLAAGRGRGFAMTQTHGSSVGHIIEISITEGQQLSIDRVVCVFDCQQVVHPDTVIAQIEGGIIYGLSAALYGEITLSDGRVDQSNFHDYRLLSLAECPEIEVHLMPQGGRPGGVGEPGVPPVAPALANAIFSVTGQRLRSLPITKHGFTVV